MSQNKETSGEADTPFFDTLSPQVQYAVQGLRGVEARVSQIRKDFRKEVLLLEAKYAEKYSALYDHRQRVVAGTESITNAELNAGEEQSKKDDEDYERLSNPTSLTPVPIPDYWLRVLKDFPGFEEIISERDEPALKYLTDVRVTYPHSGHLSFVAEFYFSANPYFSNTVLKKTYFYKDDLGFFGSLLYSHVAGDTINWKLGKNIIEEMFAARSILAKAQEAQRQADKKGEDEDDEDDDSSGLSSFFEFFTPNSLISVPEHQVPENQAGDDANEDRDGLLDDDFALGEALKDRVIHHSVEYFTGEADGYEDDEYDYDFDFDDSDEEGDDEND